MLIAILAVLKAGAAYVPVDPSYPDERIKYILEDTGGKVMLANQRDQARLANITNQDRELSILAIDSDELQAQLSLEPATNLATTTLSTNLAYVIYTSGTTGNPKGVMIEHKGVVNLVIEQGKVFELEQSKHIKNCLWYANYVFDAHVWDLYVCILYGHIIHLIGDNLRQDIELLNRYITQNNINIATLPPVLLNNGNILKLEKLTVTGDKTPKEILDSYYNAGVKIINGYGPTEVTVGVSLNHYSNNGARNVGIPMANMKAYVLGSNLEPLPIGAIGELYIGGVGLARGYLNQPNLTAERFIDNPFQTGEEKKQNRNARIYKTGDLLRWLADGKLEYIGRNDFQVKIRGYRVELGEIESAISSYGRIKQCLVLTKERDKVSGDKYLVGYYVSEERLSEDAIITYLQSKLPSYMVPSSLLHLDKLPITINGKLDRNALPDPEFISDINNYVAPRNDLELRLCSIWAEVLKVPEDKVGINDDFFRLGGNSILAIKLVSKLNNALDRSVNVSSIFKYSSISKLAHYLENEHEANFMIKRTEVSKFEEQVLSYAQERLWFIEKYEQGTNAYNIPMVFKLLGNSDISSLKQAIEAIIERHEILRTLIKEDDEGNSYQFVLDNKTNPLIVRNIKVKNENDLNIELKKEVNHIYDLKNEYPIRVCLYELKRAKKTERFISLVIHHIAFDGWSVDILLKEIQEYYSYFLNRTKGIAIELSLPELSIQYKDFAIWQKQFLDVERFAEQLSYWKNKLVGYDGLNLTTDHLRPKEINYQGANINFEIDENISKNLRQLGKELKVSLYSVLLAGYYLMLRVYSNQNDIVIGTPIANRNYPQIENLIGFFVNTLALRVEIDSDSSVKEFITKVGRDVVEAQLHQDLPFEKLVEELNVEKDTSRSPIFQVMFGVQSFGSEFNGDISKSESVNETNLDSLLELYEEDGLYNVAKFDLSVFIDDGQESLRGSFNYAVSLYNEETISNFTKTYTYILEQFTSLLGNTQKQQTTTIAKLSYLPPAVYQQLITEWNDTDSEYPDNKTIQALFEDQVERTPNNIAIVYEETKLTYRELNNEANKLANYLTNNYQIKPDSLIALCLDRSEHMLIAILAVLKAGGAYVPMDPGYPDERISYILADTQAQIVLSNEVHQERLLRLTALELEQAAQISKIQNLRTTEKIAILAIDSVDLQREYSLASTTNPVTTTASTNLAYVIYTSGTTGNPKGVMIEHIGCAIRILYMINKNELSYKDSLLFKTNLIFDVSFSDIFCTLISGAKLYITREVFDISEIKNKLTNADISICHFVPSQFDVIKHELSYHYFSKLNKLMFSGEPLDINILQELSGKNKTILNYYGPTETGEVTLNKFNLNNFSSDLNYNYSIIGKPFAHSKCYVLDRNLIPLPIGAIGELYIGGVGLARGYLNRPELTAEKFITNQFQTKTERDNKSYGPLGKNAKLYKTGDLVRYLPDGNIEYIGRNDFQVKIRGYRIELGEIENALSSYEGIKQSVVLAKEHTNIDGTTTGNKYLVGYYVAELPHTIDQQEILNYLQTKLPEYMVPNILMKIDKLPLTLNGKLDRKALPDPEFASNDSYVAPRNEIEQKVCQIWSEVLGLTADKISINDDFFRLGGNSILAIRLVSRLNKALNTSISVSSIFKQKTISKLAYYLVHNKEDIIVIEHSKVSKAEEQVLSFAQERLWFIEQYEDGSNAYNIPMVLKLSDNIKPDILAKSISSVVNRHEILRTLIKQDNEGNGYQVVLDDYQYPLQIQRIKVTNQLALDEELNKEINHIYDLSKEYPIRVQLYQLINKKNKKYKTAAENYISIVIHHIAFDGWSTDIFLQELEAYYHCHLEQSQGLSSHLNLPELSIQYKDFAVWQRSYLTGDRLNEQLNYWKNKLSDHESLNLITDHTRLSQIDYKGRDVYFELDETTSISLRSLAKELKVSLYSLLLAGYYLMLRAYSNQDDIIIGTPVANRHYPQIEHLIGFFVNSLALRTTIDPNTTLKEFIQKVGAEVVQAQLHQDLPFEKLVEELNITKDTSRHPIFQVMFGIEGFGDATSDNNQQITRILEPYTGINAYNIAKFDISSFIDDSRTQLRGSFNYAVSLYTEETISNFIKTYTYILEQFASLLGNTQTQETTTIAQLSYLPPAAYQQIITEWNDTDSEYPDNKTIQALFEDQVERTPNNIAIVYEETKLTYRELNNEANKLANYLSNHYQIKPDSLIALCLDRNEHMLIAILAVLKAGGAYVPMDPSYPDERISYILADTHPQIVLSNEIYQERLLRLAALELEQAVQTNHKQKLLRTAETAAILAIDSAELQRQYSLAPITNPMTTTTSTNLAYIIYTSGTTGTPKGVMIEHRGVVNTIFFQLNYFSLKNHSDEETNYGLISSYVFDASIPSMFLPFFTGNKLILSKKLSDVNISDFINTNQINVIIISSQILSLLDTKVDSLKNIIIGGEKANKYKVESLLKLDISIHQEYGVTESSIVSLSKKINFETELSNIGTPISNTKIYVLGANLVPLPIGAVGELYIGGIGLARGYLNRPELTAEKFIPNPFQTEVEKKDKIYGELGKNARLYKTGDLVRWLPDGNLEYIGRNDFQVKVRGYRIELGEIDNVLSSYSGIKQSVVLAKEHTNIDGTNTGNQYLVGYYVAEHDHSPDQQEILNYLQTKLPEYMVPSILMKLDKLPLTINGKLDLKALPDPEFTSIDNYLAPRNEIEKKLCRLWAELLALPEGRVGINDDFFQLGGDSILSIQLVSRLRQTFMINLSVKDIFSYRTIGSLFDQVLIKRQKENIVEIKREDGILSGVVPLLPVQQLFFENNFVENNYYNQAFMIKTSTLDLAELQVCVTKLVEYHDAFKLRYRFNNIDNTYVQYYDPNAKEEEIQTLDLRILKQQNGNDYNQKLQAILTQWQSNFDIENGPVYSIGYIHGYEDGSARVFVSLHHLIIDAISIKILAQDLKDLYQHRQLSIKGSSYRQWSEAVKDYASSHQDERGYWINVLADYNNYMQSGNNKSYAKLELDSDYTKHLTQSSNKAYNTRANDILLTALAYSLEYLTGNKVNHILLRGHGREDIDKSIDISRTIGWFSTTYPMRLNVNDDIGQSIISIKETLRQLPSNGIGYGGLFGYGDLAPKLPKIHFNYLGQFDKGDGLAVTSDLQEADFVWHLVDEQSGTLISDQNQDDSILNISTAVIDGILQFGVFSKLDQLTIDKFAEYYKIQLKRIIDYNCYKTLAEYTISDFEDFEPYIIFNYKLGEDNKPIFLLPPGEGGAESYLNNIISQLDNENLYVFNNFYLYLNTKFGSSYTDHITYETLASYYIPYIKTIQAKGPYNLLGWSFGGVLAFEIVRQLLAQGEEVANLFMIDSYFSIKDNKYQYPNNLSKINCSYSPFWDPTKIDTNIVLFKAVNGLNNNLTSPEKLNGYQHSDKYNNLDDFIPKDLIQLYKMNHDHYSWIHDPLQVQRLCNLVKKMLNRTNSLNTPLVSDLIEKENVNEYI